MKLLLTIALVLSLSGCNALSELPFGHREPLAMYDKKDAPPLENTAVLSAGDKIHPIRGATGKVMFVDGASTFDIMTHHPVWVRVLPGSHKFVIQHIVDYSVYRFKYANLDIEVEDMKPKHVYHVNYIRSGDSVQAYVEDLGESPEYSLVTGYPVKFSSEEKQSQ